MATEEIDPGLPIKLGPCSNAEFPPLPPSDLVREVQRRAWEACDENARRIGMSRRKFLLSTMGAATTLMALSACSSQSHPGTSGGSYTIPEESTLDADAAEEVLGAKHPIIDVQTHFLEYPEGESLGDLFAGFSQAACGEADPINCFRTDYWIREVFARSDTTMAVLSAIPNPPGNDPLSAQIMDAAVDQLGDLCGAGRVLVQGHAQPNYGPLGAAFDRMDEEAAKYDPIAWKTYTHVGPPWYLDDHDPNLAQVGHAFLTKVETMGIPVVAVHKGFSFGLPHSDPSDIGPAAAAHPKLSFVIYHSGYDVGITEGPYDSDVPGPGADRLVATLADADIGPGGNVYAELGGSWKLLMADPDSAAHFLGKLLVAVGEDNVVWGTDSIWFGSPQDQIQALRSFQISEELQERYGYPALTDDIKAKIFWRNSARLYGLEVPETTCRIDAGTFDGLAPTGLGVNRTLGPTTPKAARRWFRSANAWAFGP